jgi:hypothetical protein
MYVEIDLTTVPPALALREADDFNGFKVVAGRPEHAYVTRDALRSLAGDRADDPAWQEQLEGMLAYASSKGWVRDDGAVRAHVEWAA